MMLECNFNIKDLLYQVKSEWKNHLNGFVKGCVVNHPYGDPAEIDKFSNGFRKNVLDKLAIDVELIR
jgi:hypothetical protein